MRWLLPFLFCCAPISTVETESEVRSWVEAGEMSGQLNGVAVDGRAVLMSAERDDEGAATVSLNGYGPLGYVNAIIDFPTGLDSLPTVSRRVHDVSVFACAFNEDRRTQRDVKALSVAAFVDQSGTDDIVTVTADMPNGDVLETTFTLFASQRDEVTGWTEPNWSERSASRPDNVI